MLQTTDSAFGKFAVSSGVLQKLVPLTMHLLLISSSDLDTLLHRHLMGPMGTILKIQWAKPARHPSFVGLERDL